MLTKRIWVGLGAAILASADAVAFQAAVPVDTVVASPAGVRFRVERVAQGLRIPSALIFLPDGRAIVAQRGTGELSLLDVRSGATTAISGLPQVLTGEDAGMSDVVLHPDFATNHWIYFAYSEGTPERSTTVVGRGRLEGTRLLDFQRVFVADAYSEDRYHYGVRLVWMNGYLMVSVGDRHHEARAQELSTHAGKILRLKDDGTAPEDNPFVGRNDARAEIWTYGHRNPQGLTLHPETHELWSHEHGPLAGDELNVVRKGANYGWPVISYGWQYSGGPIGQGLVSRDGMERPIWVWTPAIAPSGIFFYTDDRFPEWRGSLFIGAMGGRALLRLVIANGRVALEERLLNREVGRVRLVAQGPDGYIYLGNDDGQLLRLVPASGARGTTH